MMNRILQPRDSKYYYASFNRQFAGCRDCPAGRYFFDEACEKVAWSQVGIKTQSYTKPGFGFLWSQIPKEDFSQERKRIIIQSTQFIVFPNMVRYKVVKQINEIPPFKVKDVLEISHSIGMKVYRKKTEKPFQANSIPNKFGEKWNNRAIPALLFRNREQSFHSA